ncbi:MAG TPA: fasciclin domain-containing protein [Chitinophagaceae bacterium]|nr:fasciclin domain-containing protein [Chitinophagaceae bacterium]
MKLYSSKWIRSVTMAGALAGIFSACNKELPDAEPIIPSSPAGLSIFETIRANGNIYSYLDSAIVRASTFNNPAGKLDTLLKNKSNVLTFFAPDNDAFQRSFQLLGLPTEISTIKFFRPGQLDTILRYHLIGGQKITAASIPATFPNSLYLQSLLVLQPPSATVPPGYRMPIFVGKQGATSFANNVPVIQADQEVANGIINRTSFVLLPPSQVLWQRIATDPDLTYLKAAIEKADEGDPNRTLQSALQNPAANLTVLAPSNLAFQQLLTAQITQALITMGLDTATAIAQATALASTPDVFNNPALASVLTPTTVKGIVVYHLLAESYNNTFQGIRVFSNNIPSSEINSYTLLNTAVPVHPGVTLKATYGFSGVIAITAKGLANPTAANVQINPTPAPGGTSDQHYINGTLHKIDQVLRPQ